MGPDMVIVLDPFTNNDLCFLKAIEDLPIQKVISKGAVKALTKAIFPGAPIQVLDVLLLRHIASTATLHSNLKGLINLKLIKAEACSKDAEESI